MNRRDFLLIACVTGGASTVAKLVVAPSSAPGPGGEYNDVFDMSVSPESHLPCLIIENGAFKIRRPLAGGIGPHRFVDVGTLGVSNAAAATRLGSVVASIEVFNSTGASLGFIPVYENAESRGFRESDVASATGQEEAMVMSDAHTTMQHRASEPYHAGETKLRVVHVLGDITTEASGLPTAVVPLTSALGQLGHRVELHTLGSQPAREVRHIQVVYHARWQFSGTFGLSLPLLRAVKALAAEADILHSHSLWTMPAMCPAWVGPGGRARIVISPHGTLTTRALARSKWKKRIAWWGGQRLALQHAAAFHATAESELEDIRHLGFRQPVALVPLGIDLPADPGPSGGGKDGRTLLYVGRLHPVKGLDCLIHTWTCVQDLHPGWRLVVAGGDEDAPGYGSELQRLAHRLGARRIDFVGPVYGKAKWELYRKSDLFILPSHCENFGMVVPEALGNGIPVIASKRTPWAGLKRERCGWWVENDVETLSRLLDNVFRMDSNTLADMGTRGRTWMQRDFTWNATASQITALYVWLNGLGDRPSCVHLG